MSLPLDNGKYHIENENFLSDDFALATLSEKGRKLARWSSKKTTRTNNLYYRAQIKTLSRDEAKRKQLLEVSSRKESPREPKLVKPFEKEKNRLIGERIYKRLRKVHSYRKPLAKALLEEALSENPSEDFKSIFGKNESLKFKLTAVTRILAAKNIPARLARGLKLTKPQRDASFVYWIQVYHGGKWLDFDPSRYVWESPKNTFLWKTGTKGIVDAFDSKRVKTLISISREDSPGIAAAVKKNRLKEKSLGAFSISSLPVQTQAVYRQLLLIPLGALFVAFLRNVIGLKTFGTFMPVLIALSFRETQLFWGIVLFSSIVSFGLFIRFYLERLKLLLVPRLTATLTLVIIAILMFAFLGQYFNIDPAFSVALFPLVIITMTIERMSVVWEEAGAREALQQGIGSLIVAALTYLIVISRQLEYLFFSFPELLLIVLGLSIALGRYKGYRLTEFFRFREIS